ncbi:MAG: KUP/HAK/KT family potassium transporter [Marmoricola sp.]
MGSGKGDAPRWLALGALGVVYGDIGTSPLYAMRTMLGTAPHVDRTTVYGLTSMAVWALILIVSCLYVGTLMALDHDGDGGLLALLTLVRRKARGRLLRVATVVGMIGAALFLGDSLVTPAISVLSATEGVGVAASSLTRFALPAAVVILFGVFVLQRVGSGRIGSIYGPVMVLWFLTIGVAGAGGIVRSPGSLTALSPVWAFRYLSSDPGPAFLSLGAVVLTITGAEALYADLGHFGRQAIARSWFVLVFPALVLAYVGEDAAVLKNPSAASQPFYAVLPSWATIPVLILATLATIIASEATIAGAFTVLHQAGGLELLPRMRTQHPSAGSAGRVYLPAANWTLCLAVLAIVLGFGSSSSLAGAYGVAVSSTILSTVTLAVIFAMLRGARLRAVVTIVLGIFAFVFAIATLPKVASGGWLPLLVGAALVTLMVTWQRGRHRMRSQRHKMAQPRSEFVSSLKGVNRRPGSAVFLSDNNETTPIALAFVLEQEQSIPQHVVVLSWQLDEKPSSEPHEEAVEVHRLAPDIVAVDIVIGYRDRLNPQALLRHAVKSEPDLLEGLDPDAAIYYLSQEIPQISKRGALPRWQQRLFTAIDRIAPDRAQELTLPRDRTVVLGREFTL